MKATTLDEFITMMIRFIKTPLGSVNREHLHEFCFQRWHARGKSARAGYAESTVRGYAKKFDREVGEGLPRTDRKRKTSTRIA